MTQTAMPRPALGKFGQPVLPNLNVRQLCTNCRADPPNIIEEYAKGDLVCGDCGTVLGDRIVDTRSEWRTFAGDEGGGDPSRVGDASNPLLHNDFSTQISGGDGRNGLARDLARTAARVHAQTNGKNTSAQALSSAFAKIAEKCAQMQLPRNIVDAAQHFYKMQDDQQATKNKNETAVIAACIIFGCRHHGVDRSLVELCKVFRVSKKALGAVLTPIKTAINAEFENKVGRKAGTGQANTKNQAVNFMGRFGSFLDIPMSAVNAAEYIVETALQRTDIDGRSPVSIAAGVLLFACTLFQQSTTARDIAGIAEVSESTTKLICKMVAVKLDEVIKPEWKKQYPDGYATLQRHGANDNRQSRAATPKANGTSGSTPKAESASPPSATSPTSNGESKANGTNGSAKKKVPKGE